MNQLRDELDQAKLLLDHAPDSVYWTREDGRFGYANPTACETLGYSRDELLSLSIWDIDVDLDRDEWTAHWHASEQRERVTLERRHQRKDGSTLPVEVRIRHLRYRAEWMHFSFVRDLTEQHAARDQRQAKRAYLHALFHQSPLPQLIADRADGRITDANRSAELFYGHSRGALLDRRLSDIDPGAPSDADDANAPGPIRTRHRTAEGAERRVFVYASTIDTTHGPCIHWTVQDATPLATVSAEIERYRELVQQLPIGIFRSTLEHGGQFLVANQALADLLEVDSPDQLLGTAPLDFYRASSDREHLLDAIRRNGRVRQAEFRWMTRKGRSVDVAISARLIRDGSGTPVLDGAIEDITARKRAEAERAAALARLDTAIASAPVPIMLHRPSGRIERINATWQELTGYPAEDIATLKDWTQRAYGERAGSILAGIRRLSMVNGRTDEGDFEIRCADGSTRTWRFFSAPLEPADAPDRLTISIAIDVTDARRSEERARQAQAILEQLSEGVTVTDAERRIEWVNPAFERITGYRMTEVVGKNPRVLASGKQSKEFYDALWASIDRDDRWEGRIRNRRKSGELFPEWLSITAIRDRDGRVCNYAGIFTDLTRLQRSEDERKRLRWYDPLTDLPNRRNLRRMLNAAIRSVGTDCLTVVVMGLDRFRYINESHSYHAGDQVLRQVAGRLAQLAEPGIDVGRSRGDQFVVIARHRCSHAADVQQELVQELQHALETAVTLEDGRDVRVQLSFGIARFPDHGRDPDQLLRNAEAALFEAKAKRRGGHLEYSPELTAASRERVVLESELRQAIDAEALDVHVQPIVRITDGRVVAVEALARWDHPERGSIPPDQFIPVAEDAGIIGALSLLILGKAAPAFACHPDLEDLKLAFNISASQLEHPRFAEQLIDALTATGLPSRRLDLELTENLLMQGSALTWGALQALVEHGIQLSIDDFGTGYSSLAYLQEIRAETLKIDRRFIDASVRSTSGRQIVASIIAMAHALDMKVVAEGVETDEQLALLRKLNCDFYQGYLFSKAVPIEAFIERLAGWRTPAST